MNGVRTDLAIPGAGPAAIAAFARHAVVILGVLGAAGAIPPRDLPGAPPMLTLALRLIAIGSLAAAGLSERGDPSSRAVGLRAAVDRYWPIFLPPAALLFVPADGDSSRTVRLIVVGAAATIALVRDRAAGSYLRRRVASSAATYGPWTCALLTTGVCICIAYVVVGTTATGSTDNDPAYYYGVARHLALSHRYEEPIVWHFLVKPAHVTHRPFDYWSGFASLSLLPFFWLCGASHRVAGAAMGLYSGLSVIAFAYLITVAAPVRSRVVQLVSLVLYAFSPALMRFRFDVETIPFVHLWTILALIALARRRPAWAVGFAFMLFWSRPEDVVLAVVVSAVAVAIAADQAAPGGGLRRTLLTGGLLSALYLAYHLIVFRAPLPPAAALGSRLVDYLALYRWTDAPPATWALRDQCLPEYIAGRVKVALASLQEVTFFINYPIWIALAVIRGCCWPRGRSSVEGVSWLLLFGGAVTISWVNPTMFAGWRTLHALLPVFVLAGAYGAEAILARLDRVPAARFPRAAPAWLLRPLPALLLAVAMIHPLQMSLEPGAPIPFDADLAALEPTLAGGTTMSPRPWSVIAETSSAAVSVPENGEAAIEAVLRRYGVRWLLLVGDECPGASQQICRELANGARRTVGGAAVNKRLTRGDLTLLEVAL
jgi:hypothetical protein